MIAQKSISHICCVLLVVVFALGKVGSILAFNTSSLPDTAVIVSATLKLKKQTGAGADPFGTHGLLMVDIRKLNFGVSPALGLDDFAAAAGMNNVAVVGVTPVSGYNISKISPKAFTQVNRLGLTQLRLRFQKDDNDDMSADWLAFFSSNVSLVQFRPVLEIVYYLP